MKRFIILTAVTSLLIGGRSPKDQNAGLPPSNKIEIRGIYGSPEPFWKKNLRLNELGVNAVFLHSASITDDLMKRARTEGLKVFAEFATLNGKNYVEQHPEAWAIDKSGNKVQQATWFMGVCPSDSGFKQYRVSELRKLLEKFDVDGVWMDYLHWHAQFEDPNPILPETCFCEDCLAGFESITRIRVPAGGIPQKAEWILSNHDTAWRNWRCGVVAKWVMDFKTILNREKPGALLGVYHCPWDDDDFNGARRRILGLDYDMLRKTVDVFSPMVYHERMGRSTGWVKDNIQWFCKRLNIQAGRSPKVWPIVQAHNDPGIIPAEDFDKVLRSGAEAPASGVMMFTSHSVAEDARKIEVMKKMYSE